MTSTIRMLPEAEGVVSMYCTCCGKFFTTWRGSTVTLCWRCDERTPKQREKEKTE